MMVDKKAGAKHRNKINKIVAERLETSKGKDEKEIRLEINRELRAERKKKKKATNNEEVEKIKADVTARLGDSDPKTLQKAISKATAKYYSQKKKEKSHSINKKCENIMMDHLSPKWCPRTSSWFDEDCNKAFEELQLLGAMMDINILKNPGPMEKIFAEECKEYFDLLAKKRFQTKKGDEKIVKDEPELKTKKKKAKSAINKKVQEKLAAGDGTKSEGELLKEVIAEVKETEKKKVLKDLRKRWKPSQKPWFDKECKTAYKDIVAKGAENNLKIGDIAEDYNKFKTKFKTESKAYFKLLANKKAAFDKADKEKKTTQENEI